MYYIYSEDRLIYLTSLLQNPQLFKECKRWRLDHYVRKSLDYEQNQLIKLQYSITNNKYNDNNNYKNNGKPLQNRFLKMYHSSITAIFKYSKISYSLLFIILYTLVQIFNDLKIYPLKENLSEIIMKIINL